jgi:hypothetical protein
VLVKVVIDPPGIVLVNVTTAFDVNSVGPLDDGPGGGGLTTTIEVLATVLVISPDIVLVKLVGLPKDVGNITLEGVLESVPPIIVVEATIKVVVEPFGIVLMSVAREVEVLGEDRLLVGSGRTYSIVVVTLVRIMV